MLAVTSEGGSEGRPAPRGVISAGGQVTVKDRAASELRVASFRRRTEVGPVGSVSHEGTVGWSVSLEEKAECRACLCLLGGGGRPPVYCLTSVTV